MYNLLHVIPDSIRPIPAGQDAAEEHRLFDEFDGSYTLKSEEVEEIIKYAERNDISVIQLQTNPSELTRLFHWAKRRGIRIVRWERGGFEELFYSAHGEQPLHWTPL